MEYLKDIYVLPPDISLKLEELRKRNLWLGSLFLLEKEDCINKIKRIV
jgi:hypothetical protein